MTHLNPDELDLWLEGRLPADRAQHLTSCGACAAQARQMQALVRGLEQLPEHAPSPGFVNRVMAAVEATRRAQVRVVAHQPWRFLGTRKAWATAASLAGLSFASMMAAAVWGVRHQDQVAVVAQWLTVTIREWATAALSAVAVQLSKLPLTDLGQTLAQHGVRIWAITAVSTLVYLTGCLWMRRLLLAPRRAYAASR